MAPYRSHHDARDPFVDWASAGGAGIVEIGRDKQLFLDERIMGQLTNVSRYQGRPDKYPNNPVLKSDQPWEISADPDWGGIQISGQSVLYDEEESLFKMWYCPTLTKADGTKHSPNHKRD